MEEHPGALITVVVDATFGHRIDKKEVNEFDAAVANNELVTPPAGAVGRGDAFVLSIANKAKAGILSNDSFQEFHGQYDWLFDQGRLIGGKPVPHVGWVFVERTPVRGPKSRQSVKEAKRSDNGEAPATAPTASGRRRGRGGAKSGSALANGPLPVPTSPPPGPARSLASDASPDDEVVEHVAQVVAAAAAPPPGKGPVNDLVPFLDFVERHPVGTSCTAVIESYSSHGAYARSDSVLVYIPLRLMDDPPPRSARSRLRLGEAVTLVVVGYAPERRSVDAALPHMAPAAPLEAPSEAKRPRRSRAATQAAAAAAADVVEAAVAADASTDEAEAPAPAKRSRARRGKAAPPETTEPLAEPQAAQPADAAEVAEPATAEEQPSTRRRRTKRAAPDVDTSAAEPVGPARGAKRAPKAPASDQPATPAPEAAPKKAAAKKAAAKKPAAEQAAPAKKAPAKKAAAKKAAAKKPAAAKQPAAKRAGARRSSKDTGATSADGAD